MGAPLSDEERSRRAARRWVHQAEAAWAEYERLPRWAWRRRRAARRAAVSSHRRARDIGLSSWLRAG